MSYGKIVFDTTNPVKRQVTDEKLNHMQTQYDEAVIYTNKHEQKDTMAHGIGEGEYICKTRNSNQLPHWEDITNKPQTATQDDIINLENSMSSLQQDTSSLDSRVSSLEQGSGGITEQEAEDIAASVKANNQYAVVIRVNPASPLSGEIYWVD